MILRFWNRAANAATASLAVLVMFFMASCSSTHTGSGGLPTHLPDIQLSGSNDTPPHNMASYEYPFDSNGRYVSDWAAEGERRAGRAASATSDDTSKWNRSHGTSSGSRRSSSSAKVTSSSRSGSTSKSGSSSRKIADNDDKPTGTSKPALKRKPAGDDDVASSSSGKSSTSTKAKSSSSKSGRKYTVKSGDTLSRIAANYGTSVAKIKAANGMSSDFLSIGRVLRIP
jgi:LysM repeat protein